MHNSCAKATGECTNVSQNEGGACDADKSVCTSGDTCVAGACVAGALVDCNDGNPCSDDVCDPAAGCVQKLNTLPCVDGNPCTVGDLCIGGACVPGPAKVCSDGNFCTDKSCNTSTGLCGAVPSTKPCDDGNACTQNDTCGGGTCTGASLDCDDGNPCSNDSCNPASGCVNAANSHPCSDGNPCTELDVCKNGLCTGTSPKACNDGNPCTADACNPASGCVQVANQSPCDDGNACTGGDVCNDKACAGQPVTCNDDQPCTTDSCNPGLGCVFSANALPCTDGNACTLGDVCQGGACKPGANLDCNDGNGCTTDACDPKLGCVALHHTNACDDGNGCTVGDVCSGGACAPGTNTCGCNSDLECAGQEDGNLCNGKLFCDKSSLPYKCTVNPGTVIACSTALDGFCQQNQCEPASGQCVLTPVHEGLSCDADASVCTPSDVCTSGACTAGSALNCEDGNACTNDACDPASGCQFATNTAACQDGNGCTLGDQCKNGACTAGASTKCDDLNACTVDSCNTSTGACVFGGAALGGVSCDADASLCTTSDVCQNGTCVAGAPLQCDDANQCTVDACQASSGCSNTAVSAPCDDGSGCTVGDACQGGICTAGAPLQTVTTVPVVMTESGAGKVDVILWIDTSGSMSQEALFVNQNITAFMQYLAEAGLDYRLVLIGSGQNLCQSGCPANPRFLWVKQQISSSNGLSMLLNTYPLYEAFLRADAVKNIIAVTDDESAMTPSTFKQQILTRPKFVPVPVAPLGFVYHSIVAFDPAFPDNGKICSTGAKYGKNHLQLTKDTGGAKYPVCATDWKPIFADLAKTVVKTVFAVCDYAIQVPAGVVFDALALKLSYVEPGSPEKVVPLVQVNGAAGCAAQPSGYYYDNAAAPKSVLVCDSQCKVMVSSGSLKMDFGCE